VTRGKSAASHAGQTHCLKTLFGEIGLPDTVEKISSSAAVLFVRAALSSRTFWNFVREFSSCRGRHEPPRESGAAPEYGAVRSTQVTAHAARPAFRPHARARRFKLVAGRRSCGRGDGRALPAGR
jgi:hypothetical protein